MSEGIEFEEDGAMGRQTPYRQINQLNQRPVTGRLSAERVSGLTGFVMKITGIRKEEKISRLFAVCALVCFCFAGYLFARNLFGIGVKKETVINNLTPELKQQIFGDSAGKISP